MASLTERVVQRATRQAKEFTSPEAFREYLKDHPEADKSKHTVKKPGGPSKKQPPPIPDAAKKKPVPPVAPKPEVKKEEPKAPKPEAKKPSHNEHGHGDHDEHEAPKGAKPGRLEAWKDALKGLSDAAQSFAKSALKAVKSFLGDHEFRKNTMKEAASSLAKAPKKLVDNLVDTARHEVKEFKDASAGVKAVLSGGKMTKHQKHAFKAVATHLAIGSAAAALTATGPLGAAAIFAKGLARHIAAKSVHKAMGHLHVMDELGHVGHGIHHLMEHFASEDGKGADSDEVMTNFILAAVAKTLEEELSDEDLTKVLNEMKGGESDEKPKEKTASERVAARLLVP